MIEKFGDVVFRAESVDWKLKDYLQYMNCNRDESPLYLFDSNFVEKMDLVVSADGSYNVPECFAEDFFALFGKERPHHRWLIIGPERSGSTFHKDPNATSAWNAVIKGSKYWIMFPPETKVPGVYVSDDQGEVTSPLSIAEWLLGFQEEARKLSRCVEGVCEQGEVLHVPSGWWHLVVNLEPAIAITQNFVPELQLKAAHDFLKTKPAQVSGFQDAVTDPYAVFVERLEATYPELASTLNSAKTRKRTWDEVVNGTTDEDAAMGRKDVSDFNFGFGDDYSDED